MTELEQLLLRITDSEDFIDRAERFFKENSKEWSDELAISFESFLENKREQVWYEKVRVERMGWNVALGTWPPRMDI